MTTQTAPLEYATPRAAGTGGRGYLGLAAALALAVGFLGANAFADAAGFPTPRNPERDSGYVALRVLCGVVVFVISFVVFVFVFRELRALVHTMARAPVRPAAPVALASLVCGTACVVAALAVQLYGMRNPVIGFGPGPQLAVQTPLMAHLVTLMAFLLGVALIAVGIWSSMGRQSPPPPPTLGG
jgi:hypothetical protein